MKKLTLLIAVASMLITSPAMAEQMQTFKSGSNLQLDCSSLSAPLKSETKLLLDTTCLNYIKGVFDLHQTLVGSKIIKPQFCKPKDVDLGQLARTVLEYIETNHEKAEITASSLILPALSEAFPCNESPPPK
jgi:hypothetical protein